MLRWQNLTGWTLLGWFWEKRELGGVLFCVKRLDFFFCYYIESEKKSAYWWQISVPVSVTVQMGMVPNSIFWNKYPELVHVYKTGGAELLSAGLFSFLFFSFAPLQYFLCTQFSSLEDFALFTSCWLLHYKELYEIFPSAVRHCGAIETSPLCHFPLVVLSHLPCVFYQRANANSAKTSPWRIRNSLQALLDISPWNEKASAAH